MIIGGYKGKEGNNKIIMRMENAGRQPQNGMIFEAQNSLWVWEGGRGGVTVTYAILMHAQWTLFIL